MTSRYSIILTFILATLLATGTVELFYRSFNKAISSNEKTLGKDMKHANFSRPQRTLLQQTDTTTDLKNNNYTSIIQRNLFGSSSNTISAIPFSTEQILDTTSLDLILLGTIQGSANSQRAIIRSTKSDKQDLYSQGDTIEYALIKKIMRGKIILTVNGRDEVLLMGEIKSPPLTTHKTPSAPKNSIKLPETYAEEQSPPAAIPKRRLTLQSKKQPAEE